MLVILVDWKEGGGGGRIGAREVHVQAGLSLRFLAAVLLKSSPVAFPSVGKCNITLTNIFTHNSKLTQS